MAKVKRIAPDEQPSDEEIRRYDRQRKNKRVSNEEWKLPTDGDAKIAQLKDGRTHLAYKAEHAVDLQHDLIVAAEIHPADTGDAQTMVDTLMAAHENLRQAGSDSEIDQVAADKGYHSAQNLELCDALGFRTYIPEPRRPHGSTWTDKPAEHHRSVTNNRRRVKRTKSKRLQKRRSECCERTFAHVCDTGGARRSWLRGAVNVAKRYLISAAAHNLGRILRRLLGIGKPKALQDAGGLAALAQLRTTILLPLRTAWCALRPPIPTAFALAA